MVSVQLRSTVSDHSLPPIEASAVDISSALRAMPGVFGLEPGSQGPRVPETRSRAKKRELKPF